MSDDKCAELIERVAEAAAEKAVKRLLKSATFKRRKTDSFRKTEELLEIFPKLDKENPIRQKICTALKLVMHDEYYGIIEERYFYRRTLEEIAEIFDTKYQTISRNRVRLVREIARELFPDEVAEEIMND